MPAIVREISFITCLVKLHRPVLIYPHFKGSLLGSRARDFRSSIIIIILGAVVIPLEQTPSTIITVLLNISTVNTSGEESAREEGGEEEQLAVA